MADHLPIVEVTWIDPHTGCGWESVEAAKAFEFPEMYAAGYLLRKDESVTMLAMSYGADEDNHEVNGTLVIPTSCVLSMRVLRGCYG